MQTCFPLPSTLSMNSGIGSLAVCNPMLLIKIVSNHSPQVQPNLKVIKFMLLIKIVSKHSAQFQPNLVIGDKTDQHSSSQMSASSEFSNIYNFSCKLFSLWQWWSCNILKIQPWKVATCVFQDGVINKPANHVDQGGVDCAENIVRVRGEVDHLNCHLLKFKGKRAGSLLLCCLWRKTRTSGDVGTVRTDMWKLKRCCVFFFFLHFLLEEHCNIHTFPKGITAMIILVSYILKGHCCLHLKLSCSSWNFSCIWHLFIALACLCLFVSCVCLLLEFLF